MFRYDLGFSSDTDFVSTLSAMSASFRKGQGRKPKKESELFSNLRSIRRCVRWYARNGTDVWLACTYTNTWRQVCTRTTDTIVQYMKARLYNTHALLYNTRSKNVQEALLYRIRRRAYTTLKLLYNTWTIYIYTANTHEMGHIITEAWIYRHTRTSAYINAGIQTNV